MDQMMMQQQPQQPMQPMGAYGAAPMGGGQQLDPQLVQAILQMQGQQSQQGQVNRQMALADKLRNMATDRMKGQGGGQMVGQVYVPTSGLSAAANMGAGLLANRAAERMQNDADTRSANMDAQKQDALTRYFRAMTGQRAPMLPHMGDEGE